MQLLTGPPGCGNNNPFYSPLLYIIRRALNKRDVFVKKVETFANNFIFFAKRFGIVENSCTFASAFENECSCKQKKEFFEKIYIDREVVQEASAGIDILVLG